jgi:uncharacterized protein YdaU (DUF1376 family)
MSLQWYARYPGDYMRDTAHLTLIQHGAYTRLLDHYYATGKPLPEDLSALHRLCSAMTREERAAVDSIAIEFFPVNGDGQRHNKRADIEIRSRQEQHKLLSQAGSLGVARREAKRKPGMMPGMNEGITPGVCKTTSTTTTTSRTTPTPPTPQGGDGAGGTEDVEVEEGAGEGGQKAAAMEGGGEWTVERFHVELVGTGKFPNLTVEGVRLALEPWKGWRGVAARVAAEAQCLGDPRVGNAMSWISRRVGENLLGAEKNAGAKTAPGRGKAEVFRGVEEG